jgi:hypothetical protein
MDPRDERAMLGAPIQNFLRDLTEGGLDKRGYGVHFVTAREMVNIALSACDGHSGNPGQYRDYRFQLIRSCTERCVGATAGRKTHKSVEF